MQQPTNQFIQSAARYLQFTTADTCLTLREAVNNTEEQQIADFLINGCQAGQQAIDQSELKNSKEETLALQNDLEAARAQNRSLSSRFQNAAETYKNQSAEQSAKMFAVLGDSQAKLNALK